MMRVVTLLTLWCAVAPAQAATVVVSPGDDVYALTSSLGPGDVVRFNDGVFELDGALQWVEFAGTESARIEIIAAEGATPILRQSSGSWVAELRDSAYVTVKGLIFEGAAGWEQTGQSGFRIYNSSDVVFQDCEVRNVTGTAVRFDGNISNLTAERLQIHHTFDGHGLEVGCGDASCWMQDSVIADSWIHDIGGEGSDGLRLLNGCQNNEITDNIIHDIGDDGVYFGSTEFGPQNTFIGNAIWSTGDIGLYIQGAVLVQNNLIYDVAGNGIRTDAGDRDNLDNVVISHNTVVNTGEAAAYLDDVFFRTGIVFANNALANPTGYGLSYDPNYDAAYDTTVNYVSHNVVTGLVQNLPDELWENGVIAGGGFGDYEDALTGALYPVGTSAIVNAGDKTGAAFVPVLDFNGLPRDGNAPDVGAYEWDGDGNPGWIVDAGFKQFEGAVNGSVDVSSGCCSEGADEEDGGKAALLLPLLLLAGFRRRRK
ncbi:MAG: hypothetical protein GWP91_24145 [Rhodobacterales bacterium]|nr:hypothetical protein [Rhodobacterales bacterium]